MLHRGARPAPRELPEPEQFVALHRTLGVESNGSVSNMAFTAATATRLGHELRSGSYDVLHVHEPNAGLVPWYAIENARVPVVGIAGRVSEDEKWRLLHDADLLCAPSLGGESFGIVLLESLASGTPVVCSDIPGYRDVVRDDVEGRLVPAGDPAALGEAIRALAVRRQHRVELSAAARERA